jgi:hypothetical protein
MCRNPVGEGAKRVTIGLVLALFNSFSLALIKSFSLALWRAFLSNSCCNAMDERP